MPKETIDTTKLLANTCIVRKDKPEGTFYITGTGGLPNRPGDISPSQCHDRDHQKHEFLATTIAHPSEA